MATNVSFALRRILLNDIQQTDNIHTSNWTVLKLHGLGWGLVTYLERASVIQEIGLLVLVTRTLLVDSD